MGCCAACCFLWLLTLLLVTGIASLVHEHQDENGAPMVRSLEASTISTTRAGKQWLIAPASR